MANNVSFINVQMMDGSTAEQAVVTNEDGSLTIMTKAQWDLLNPNP